MNTSEKEKQIIELRLKQIESIDNDLNHTTNKIIITLLVICGGVFTAMVTSGIQVYPNRILETITGLIGVLLLLWVISARYKRYIEYCYDSLANSIKSDSILDYKIPELKKFQFWFRKLSE